MTLNAVIALILRFLRNSTDFQADYITVVEDRPIMSVKYCLPVPVFYFTRCLHHLISTAVFHILVDFTTYDTVHGEAVLNKKKYSTFGENYNAPCSTVSLR